MIHIKAVVNFGQEGFISGIRSALGFPETEIKEFKGVRILYINTSKKMNRKRLEKILLKHKVRDVAIVPQGEYDHLLCPLKFRVIKEDKLMISLVPQIVKRLAGSMGIKKGRTRLGIYSENYPEKILEKMKDASDSLSEIYIYGKRNGRIALLSEEFFAETGISVILSDKIKDDQCDILIAEGKNLPVEEFKGGVIRIGGVPFGKKCVTGLRLKIPEEVFRENLADAIVCELYGITPEIDKLIVKKNKK